MGNLNGKKTEQIKEENYELEFAKLFVALYLKNGASDMLPILNYHHYLISLQKNANKMYFDKKNYYLKFECYKPNVVCYYYVLNKMHFVRNQENNDIVILLNYLRIIVHKYQSEPHLNYTLSKEYVYNLKIECYETNKIIKNICEKEIHKIQEMINDYNIADNLENKMLQIEAKINENIKIISSKNINQDKINNLLEETSNLNERWKGENSLVNCNTKINKLKWLVNLLFIPSENNNESAIVNNNSLIDDYTNLKNNNDTSNYDTRNYVTSNDVTRNYDTTNYDTSNNIKIATVLYPIVPSTLIVINNENSNYVAENDIANTNTIIYPLATKC